MPQLLYELGLEKEDNFLNTLDWGILTVYTCPKSCDPTANAYKDEFLWRQNYSNKPEKVESEDEESEDEKEEKKVQ